MVNYPALRAGVRLMTRRLKVIHGGGKPRELTEEDYQWAAYLRYMAEKETDPQGIRILTYLAAHILREPILRVIEKEKKI